MGSVRFVESEMLGHGPAQGYEVAINPCLLEVFLYRMQELHSHIRAFR